MPFCEAAGQQPVHILFNEGILFDVEPAVMFHKSYVKVAKYCISSTVPIFGEVAHGFKNNSNLSRLERRKLSTPSRMAGGGGWEQNL
jgi:hypothetical protein